MVPIPSTFGATVAINVKLLMACGFGYAAWSLWPTSAQWWGLGVTSILLGFGAFGLVLNAVQLMARVYARERALREYLKLGPPPKDAKMASPDQLDQAGMR